MLRSRCACSQLHGIVPEQWRLTLRPEGGSIGRTSPHYGCDPSCMSTANSGRSSGRAEVVASHDTLIEAIEYRDALEKRKPRIAHCKNNKNANIKPVPGNVRMGVGASCWSPLSQPHAPIIESSPWRNLGAKKREGSQRETKPVCLWRRAAVGRGSFRSTLKCRHSGFKPGSLPDGSGRRISGHSTSSMPEPESARHIF